MSASVSLHVRTADEIRVVAHDPTKLDWISVEFAAGGHCPIHCDDADTAERLARGFTELAAKMRERRGLPDPAPRELVEFA